MVFPFDEGLPPSFPWVRALTNCYHPDFPRQGQPFFLCSGGKGTNRYRVDPRSGASSSLGRVFSLTVGDAVEEETLKTHGYTRALSGNVGSDGSLAAANRPTSDKLHCDAIRGFG